jgi:hypothetical protein
MAFWLALSGRLKAWAIGVGAVLVAIAGAYWRGKSDANAEAHERELNEYVATRARIDESTPPENANEAREWLKNRNDK